MQPPDPSAPSVAEDRVPATQVRASGGLKRFAETHDLQTLVILSLLMAFSSISTDIYLPALPAIDRKSVV